jgi:vancomycin permeability regulator SanA
VKKAIKRFLEMFLFAILIIAAFVLTLNLIVVASARGHILASEDAAAWAQEESGASCVLVLGAAVWDGKPSPILANRLNAGLDAFAHGASNLLLLSGDNGTVEYNEVQGMKNYVLENGTGFGAGDANIYLDYAGFSTYASMYRSQNIFEADRVVIVTQRYHLYRALYIAETLGLEARGVAAEDCASGQFPRDVREIFARVKDFFLARAGTAPSVMGESVPLVYPSTQAVPGTPLD